MTLVTVTPAPYIVPAGVPKPENTTPMNHDQNPSEASHQNL